MQAKVTRWGNSLGLRIPKLLAEEIQVTDGAIVDISLENGNLIIKPVPQKALSLDELLKQVTDENIHSEIDFGKPIGKERW